MLVSRALFGSAFADTLLDDYRERSENGTTSLAILETENASPDREVNRYARPVVILEQLRREVGDERMAAFTRALYARFSRERRATTPALLEEAESHLGAVATRTLRDSLSRKGWGHAIVARTAISTQDAPFLGTWRGVLTQGSVTNPVVLRLAERDGSLVASLDHPDPAEPPIPLPTASIAGGELRFAIGTFGIAFRGTLQEGATRLEGEWRQGGVSYRLSLSRSEPPR